MAASALTIARRIRSWMTRSSSGSPRRRSRAGLAAARAARARAACGFALATVPPRDQRCRRRSAARRSRRRGTPFPRTAGEDERGDAEQHEERAHREHDAHRHGAAGHDRGAVEEQPDPGQQVDRPARSRARVRTAPAPSGGTSVSRKRRAGPREEIRPRAPRLAGHRRDADRDGDAGLGEPDAEPPLGRAAPGARARPRPGPSTPIATPPQPGHRRERGGALHRVADEPEVVGRLGFRGREQDPWPELYGRPGQLSSTL